MKKYDLRQIISGTGETEQAGIIQAIARYLRECQKASEAIKGERLSKQEQENCLRQFINEKQLWYGFTIEQSFIAEGAEQRVFLLPDGKNVIKLNDSIFYAYWKDYFESLLLHNYFFPATEYKLSGFLLLKNNLFAVVQQPFVMSTEITDLNKVKEFMLHNGFVWKKNNDYYHPSLGIILEDLHDENVLTNTGVLFFVDTVFYLADDFWDGK